jgi:hypothetical protein
MTDRKNFLSIERAHVFSFFLTAWCRTIELFAGFSGLEATKTPEIIGDLTFQLRQQDR